MQNDAWIPNIPDSLWFSLKGPDGSDGSETSGLNIWAMEFHVVCVTSYKSRINKLSIQYKITVIKYQMSHTPTLHCSPSSEVESLPPLATDQLCYWPPSQVPPLATRGAGSLHAVICNAVFRKSFATQERTWQGRVSGLHTLSHHDPSCFSSI